MPEICTDAALYFDPFNVEDIAAKLRQANSNGALLNQLSERARSRAKYFGWEMTARGTLQFFDMVLNRNQFNTGIAAHKELVKV